jgi:ribosomal protein S18 acetylase RimI-like enzyme
VRSSGTRLRPATAGDGLQLVELWREAGAAPTRTDDLGSIEKLLTFDPGAVIVAEADSRIVGSVIAGWDGWRGSIYRLAVVPDFRRQGLGRQLVAEAQRRLEEVGARRLQAIVVETDPQATSFWRASGWEEQVARVRFVTG